MINYLNIKGNGDKKMRKRWKENGEKKRTKFTEIELL